MTGGQCVNCILCAVFACFDVFLHPWHVSHFSVYSPKRLIFTFLKDNFTFFSKISVLVAVKSVLLNFTKIDENVVRVIIRDRHCAKPLSVFIQ